MEDLPQQTRFQQFTRGARYAFGGMKLVLTHPGLWPYVIAPVVITLSAFFALIVFAFPVFGYLLGQLWVPGETTSWWVSFAWHAFWWFVRISIVMSGAVVLYFTSGIVATPFYDRLSERVESMVFGPYSEPFSWNQLLGDLAYSVIHSAASLAVWLTVLGCSLMLNLMPGIGSVIAFVIGAVATAFFVSRESMDGAMSRRRMTFRHKFQILSSQFYLMLGFGLVMSALLWIPLLNFLVLPMGVAGGTLMYCHLEKAGLVPDANGRPGFTSARLRVEALADHGLVDDIVGLGPDGQPVREPEVVRAG